MFLNLRFETNLRLKGLPSKSSGGSLVCREVAFCTKVTQVYWCSLKFLPMAK